MAAPGLSIREQILSNVFDTLVGVTTGAGFSTTIQTVTRGHLSPLESFSVPFASILPVSDTAEYSIGILRRVLTFTVRIWIDAAPHDAPTVLEALLADIQQALEADVTRGQLAQLTLETSTNYIYEVSTERLAACDCTWEIHYRQPLTDPRAQG